jgi:hypothetical protein
MVSIRSFLDYKLLLQENYMEYKHIYLPLLKLVSKILCLVFIVMIQLHVCIPRSFLVINVYNQGKTSCSPCIYFILLCSLNVGRVAPSVSDWLWAGWPGDRIPVGARFLARPNRPWGPPSLLYNWYRVFPRGKEWPGRDADHSPPSSTKVLEE